MKKLLAMLLAVAMVFALATAAMADESEAVKDEITVGWYGTNQIVNPFCPMMCYSMAMCGMTQAYLIYDSLIYFDNEGNTISRMLDDWYFEDDTHLVMKLKDGIYFSNGEQLTGEDVVFTLQALADGFFPIKFMYTHYDMDATTVSEDGLTVTLAYPEVYAPALSFLNVPILCKSYIESVGGENIDWFDPNAVVGSGPYVCTEFVDGSHSVYELRDDYWGNEYGYEQSIKKITVQLYSDSTAMMSDYVNGIIDLAWGVTADDYDMANNGEYADSATGFVTNSFVSWLVMDVDGVLSDPAIREAICYALDTDAIRQAVMGSLAGKAEGAFATSMLGFTDDFQYSFDLDHAKQVLADAGYSDGDITITYAYKTEDPNQAATAELVQAYLLAVGINVELKGLDEATYSVDETEEGYSDLAYYWMSNGATDPAQFMGNFVSTQSQNGVMNRTEYDELILTAGSTTDEEVRTDLYHQIQELWFENFDLVPLYEYHLGYIYKTDVFTSAEIMGMNGNMLELSVK